MDIFPKKTYKRPIGIWKDAERHQLSGKCKSKPQWDITPCSSEWPSSKDHKRQMLAKMCRKGNPCTLLVGRQIGVATMENSMEAPQKIKNRTTIWSSNPNPGHTSKEKEKKTLKNGVIEGQQRVGLRCLGGLSGHFDNMASPLACLIVMFNGHPCSLRWHF